MNLNKMCQCISILSATFIKLLNPILIIFFIAELTKDYLIIEKQRLCKF